MTYIIIFIFVVFLISALPFSASSKKQIQKEINEQNKLNELINNNVTIKSKEYINKNFTEAIVLDETNKKIHFLSIITNKCKTYNFDDLIESEVIIDNDSITKTNRANQIIGSAVGLGIAGIPGMIIGGISSSTITSEKIKNITLKLTFNDLDNPIYKLNFLSTNGSTKDSHEYKVAMNFIDRWYGYFIVILKQQNKAISN